MSRSARLQPLQRLAEQRENEAARAVADALRKLEEQRQQLQGLNGFRHEYNERFARDGQAGMSVGRMLDWRRFLARLDTALEQQEEAITRAELECERVKKLWVLSRRNSDTYDLLAERYRLDELQQQARSEQKESDEYAARRPGGS